ncbi:MAG: hypothetical protein ABR964_08820 [Tepidisphaeraceae bacterium]
MPVKRTYFHRNFAIVHRVFATDQSEATLDQFIVNKVGESNQLFAKATLEEAKLAIDELIAAGGQAARWQVRAASA